MHRFLVPGLTSSAERLTLPRGEAHHLARVLRLRPGTDVVLFDGRGREWLARVADVGRVTVSVDLVSPRAPVPEPPVPVTLAQAVLKGDQMDAAVRDATLCGAAVIAPFASARVAVAERAWRTRSIERWQRVAEASAKQCRRAVVPVVRPVVRFDELLAATPASLRLVSVEPSHAGGEVVQPPVPRPADALVCIGPEGGWAPEELELADRAGCQRITCGPRTLRADVAPVVVLTVLWTWWGWQ